MDSLFHVMKLLMDLGYSSLAEPRKTPPVDEVLTAEERGDLEDEAYDKFMDDQIDKGSK